MTNLSLSDDKRTHALIIAPKGGKNAEVAAYTTSSGDLLISNSNIRPFSPIDGSHLQPINNNFSELDAKYIQNRMVKIGRCEACDNDIVATAGLADAIETANSEFHCPMCSSTLQHSINNNQLIAALAEEYDPEEDSEDSDNSDDEDSDMSDDDSDGDAGEDYSDDDSDMSDDDSDGEDYSDDDEGSDDDSEDDEDSDGEDYSDDDEGSDDDSEDDSDTSDDDSDGEDSDGEDYSDDDSDMSDEDNNDESDEDAIPEDQAEDDGEPTGHDDVYNDDEVEKATAAFKKIIAYQMGTRPIAGKGVDRPDIDSMNERARETVKTRHADKTDGNSYMKGVNAVAKEAVAATEGQDITPGTTEVPGEMNQQVVTPGSNVVDGNTKTQPKTIGTEVSGDLLVDWNNDKIELVATSDVNNLWVFANNNPVGRLIKEKASTGIQSRWKEVSGLQNAFVAVAKRGLSKSEADEFGFEAKAFTVEGDKVVRSAMQRQAQLATENAKKEVARSVERYKQSVRSAMVASFKGIYPDLTNPLRDQLITTLASISVAEPRSVIDTAFAKTVENLLVNVFNKADEIAGKSDEVRNEIASYVADATFQSRIDEGSALAAKLSSNNNKMVAAQFANNQNFNTNSSEKDFGKEIRKAIFSLK